MISETRMWQLAECIIEQQLTNISIPPNVDPDDLRQEAKLRAIRLIGDYDSELGKYDEKSFCQWAHKALFGALVDYLRKHNHSKRRAKSFIFHQFFEYNITGSHDVTNKTINGSLLIPAPEDQALDHSELLEYLQSMLGERDGEIMYRYCVLDQSPDELAEMFNLSWQLIFYIRRKCLPVLKAVFQLDRNIKMGGKLRKRRA